MIRPLLSAVLVSVAILASAYVALVLSVPAHGAEQRCGVASWYGNEHHGRHTASGKVFNQWGLSAAHMTLPFGTKLRVSYQGRSVDVVVNDRGNFAKYGRIIDLSRGAFRKLANERVGVLKGVCLTRIN